MSYQRSPHVRRVRRSPLALSGVENCGPDQVWDPNIEYLGQKGQCMPRKNYTNAQLENPNAFPTSVKVTGASSGGGWSSGISKLLGSLVANAVTPAQAQPVVVAPSSGLSPATVAIGGAALLGVLYIALKD